MSVCIVLWSRWAGCSREKLLMGGGIVQNHTLRLPRICKFWQKWCRPCTKQYCNKSFLQDVMSTSHSYRMSWQQVIPTERHVNKSFLQNVMSAIDTYNSTSSQFFPCRAYMRKENTSLKPDRSVEKHESTSAICMYFYNFSRPFTHIVTLKVPGLQTFWRYAILY